jgi:hypothetical protein
MNSLGIKNKAFLKPAIKGSSLFLKRPWRQEPAKGFGFSLQVVNKKATDKAVVFL